MEPNEKPRFNWQRTLITTGIVLLAALAVGGTTWYVMDKSAREIKTANDKSVAVLQKQIDELEKNDTSAGDDDVVTDPVLARRDLNEALISSGTYTIEDKTFTMVNGVYTEGIYKYEFVTPLSTSRSSLITDAKTVAAVIKMTAGGTGAFKYLTIVENINGQTKSVASVKLGDRVQINKVALADSTISGVSKVVTLTMVDFGPNDSACCPTVNTTKTFYLTDANKLVLQ